ncbi:hypothetical protein PS900_00966 [Pseudomonas fluorescens]|uniref:Uncharacterized protein n=1 Tax=Pseudomonas fluorescens TaxID=294 RepID=A0A8H2NNA7_PSEFL|nr:hypothetical protein PS900_00966 [Pseudomonas fluorescens]
MDSNIPLRRIEVDRTQLDILVLRDDGTVAAPQLTVFVDPLTKTIIHTAISFPEDTDKDEP